MGPLGILAGAGDLPRRLVSACADVGRPCFVIAFEGHTDKETASLAPAAWVRLGAAGRTIDLLRQAGVSELVFAGAMKRPSLLGLAPDAKGAAILARIGIRALGDDGLLRAIAGELEKEGFRVLGVQEVLNTLLAPAGNWGRYHPDEQGGRDIERGLQVLQALGAVDVGQAVVVQQGLVLGVEAIEGTDALLRRAGELRRDGPGGVLVKRAKPGQDHRLDLPTVGPTTIEGAVAAGLRGVAVHAGACLVLDYAGVVERADRHGIFVSGVTIT